MQQTYENENKSFMDMTADELDEFSLDEIAELMRGATVGEIMAQREAV
jgi:hypothetical protein